MKKANERKQGWVHLDKIDLKVKTVIRDPEGRYTMMKKINSSQTASSFLF